MDRVWIWFAENGNIRKWQSTPFQDGVEYRPALPAVKALIEEAVQATIDAGLAVNGEYGVAAARHAARYALSALVSAPADPAPAPTADVVEALGWIVGSGDGKRWRRWGDTGPEWTEDREQAVRYARREDAESVHREDEDAWQVVPYASAPAKHEWRVYNGWWCCAKCGIIKNEKNAERACKGVVKVALRAAPAGDAVKALEWADDRDDDGTEIHRARGGNVNLPYAAYEDWFTEKPFGLLLNQLRIGSFDSIPEAKAAAQADYARRILSAIEPSALPNYVGWRSIDTAPEDCRVILAAAGNWVGEAIMLRDEDSGEQVWTWVDTGKPCRHSLYGWMHLPSPLSSPVLSDLRPDGFDGPTGAE